MQALVQAYLQYLKSRQAMGKAIEEALAGKKYLPDATVKSLALAHAQFYACNAKQDPKTKQWHFYNADGVRNNSARVQWERNIRPYHNAVVSKRGGARHKTEKQITTQRDFVLKAFMLLSASDRKWILKQAGL